MYFVDSTGHTFYQMSFKYDPIGFEFYQNKYTFWVDNKDHSYCSINNYYIRPIYILLDHKAKELEIIADSQIFTLISSTTVAENFAESIRQLELDEEEFIYFDEENNKSTKSDLHLDAERNDILELEVLSSDGSDEPITKYMYPFYVIANSPVPGTFFTNILIYAKYVDSTDTEQEEWCPITVGGEFNEENEILYINGLNMGVRLPHEIIRSVYNASYNNDVFDEDLYNEKLKEYLIEYMSIRGEIGNYRSAINSLKWFGWGNKVELVSLLKTDNQFMTQFIRDYFDTNSDIIESFKHFINSTLLSLVIWENKETGEYDTYDLNADFMGENQPLLEDLFNKTIPVLYGGVGEETYYYKTYYNFIFGELLFKISALKYYYEKYFLPVHLSIHNASLHHKVYTNDIKMLNRSSMNIAEPIIKMGLWKDNFVEFPKDNEIWLTEQIHIIDKQYNEWNLEDIIKESEKYDYYYLHDTCGNIPIKFINYENEPQMHVHMIFEKLTSDNDNVLYINNKINLFTDSIEVYDVTKRKIDINNTFISYSQDNGKTYSPFFLGLNTVNDILNTYNKKDFDIKNDENGQHYIEINDEKIYLSDEEQTLYFGDDNNQYYIIVPSLDKVNIDLFNNLGDCTVTYHKDVLLRLRIENDRIYKCNIIKNDVITDVTNDITIMYSPTSEVFYESDFIFNPNDADKYLSFVLYPKMFNNSPTDIIYNRYGENLTNKKIDITYFINNRFRLRMLVNNKWHDYEFVVKMPDIQIEFGKLIYKYYDDELKFYTRFNQLNELTDTTLRFNAFMHEPRMTRINHVNFMEDFLKYLKISNARYIDGNMIPTNEFYYYIDVNFIDEDGIEYKQRIYITNNDYGNDLIIPRKYFNYDMIYYLFLDSNMLYIFGEERINNIYDVIAIEGSTLIYDNDFDDFNDNHDNANFYIDVNNYKRFIYNSETNQYETDTSRGVVSFNINESLRSDFNTFTSKYIETHSITNNYKYLNQIHVYDLYRLNSHEGNNLIALQNNIDLMYHGIRFTHKSFLSENTISIVGNTNNLITNSDERINNNKSFLSDLYESDDKTSYSYYSNYINTYDDLVIYSAYEGDWIRPLGTIEGDDIIEPTGYVYYEMIDRNGTPTGQYTTESINVVTDNIMTYFDSDYTEEYKDFEKLEDFKSWLYDDNVTYVKNDTEYYILHNAIHNNKLYIERNNVDDTTTNLYYTVELVEQHKISKEEKIINPTYSEYKNIIEESLVNGPESTNYEYLYKLRIRTFIESHRLVSNIQRIYEGEAECVNDVYSVNINGTNIKLLPFYAEYDGNHDVLFNVKSLIQQPGIDWIDINDIDETIYDLTDLDMDDDYIELTDINNDITDEDIRSLLNHRKILILNITSRLLNSVHAYEETMSFKDYVLNIKDNDITTIPLTFKINNNVIDTDDNVTIKTVIRCRYKNKNDIYEYDFYDNVLNINTLLINENDEYHINCSSGEDSYITHVMESGEEIMYDNFTVFFVLIPNTTETDTEFAITFNPRITLVYNDYDILEYPNDSFDSSLNYNGDNYVTYKINDTVYKYGDCREVKSVVDLYNEFFDSKTVVFNSDYQFTNIECNDQLNIDKNNVEYDMYLMHNTKDWYILYISKDTCDKTLALYDYEPSKKEIIFITDNHQYKLVHNSSTKKFLINRYVYSSANGKNHFNVNDIIVGKVLNNERLPIDIFKTQKWEMAPVSIDVDKKLTTSTSNIDMCIFDAPTYNNEYVKGYYDVTYRYTLDRISTQQHKKYGTIRIG